MENLLTTTPGDNILNPDFEKHTFSAEFKNTNIDNSLAAILGKFNDEYLMDVIQNSINNNFRLYENGVPNIVYGFESEFNNIIQGFAGNVDDITVKRINTYSNIIDIICQNFNLTPNNIDDVDLYSAAFHLYDFFVSNFARNIVTLFTNFILKNYDTIYNSLQLGSIKIPNNYNLTLFQNTKLNTIHALINYVLDNMSAMDIDLFNIFNLVYSNQDTASYLYSLVSDNDNFFRVYIYKYISDPIFGIDLQTYIKLNLQTLGKDIPNNI